MLRYTVFSSDEALLEELAAQPGLHCLHVHAAPLTAYGLMDYVRAYSPQVMFFDLEWGRGAIEEAARLTPAQLVAVGREMDAELLVELMHVGVREFLRFPFDGEKLAAALARLEQAAALAPVERESTELLFSVLPAKAGCGASTVAIHTALELSQRPHSRVLLVDLDLNEGLSRFLLKLTNPLSLRDAVARIDEMDDGLWQEVRSTREDLDVLPGGLIDPVQQLEPERVRALFEFARRRYRMILADHSGALEPYSVQVLEQSRRIMLVVEPDLAAVHMAREKLRFLEARDLGDRVALIINRWRKEAPLTITDIESVLGVPAEFTFSEAGEQVYKSVMRGGALDPASTYYREVADLATWLGAEAGLRKGPKPKRKVEYFSLLPSRYSLSRG